MNHQQHTTPQVEATDHSMAQEALFCIRVGLLGMKNVNI